MVAYGFMSWLHSLFIHSNVRQHVCMCACTLSVHWCTLLSDNPANTRRWPNVGLILAHRLRRWPNINPTLGQRLVFAGKRSWVSTYACARARRVYTDVHYSQTRGPGSMAVFIYSRSSKRLHNINPWNSEIFLYKPCRPIFFQFHVLWNDLVTSFRFIWIPML